MTGSPLSPRLVSRCMRVALNAPARLLGYVTSLLVAEAKDDRWAGGWPGPQATIYYFGPWETGESPARSVGGGGGPGRAFASGRAAPQPPRSAFLRENLLILDADRGGHG